MGFFQRKPPEPPPPKTHIARGTQLQGDLECKDEMTMEGALEGSIRCHGRILMNPSARFSGNLISDSLRCEGSGEGFVDVEGTASFGPTASWSGEFKTGTLHVEKGACLEGTFRPSTQPAAKPSRQQSPTK